MKYHNLTLFVFAALSAAGTYAQEQKYATEITEDTQYNAPLTEDTAIKNGATLTLTTSNTGSNYNLLIESGAKLVHGVDSTDAIKWGTGSPNSMSAVIENYGTIDMQSNGTSRHTETIRRTSICLSRAFSSALPRSPSRKMP